MIFDSHFHITSMAERGLPLSLPESFLGLECATEPGDGEKRIRLIGERRDVYLSMGAGPWVLQDESWKDSKEALERIKKDIERYGADAIGECGFDHHYAYGSRKDEMELFLLQAELAKELDIPLIIHSRDADEEIMKVLPLLGNKTIMHCFSSGPHIAERLLERGVYLSFAGNVTYKANKAIQESARICPKERLLYETDSPYLTPVPLRGKPNSPENSEYTLTFLSQLKEMDKEEIKRNAVQNFLSLFENRESKVRRDFFSTED